MRGFSGIRFEICHFGDLAVTYPQAVPQNMGFAVVLFSLCPKQSHCQVRVGFKDSIIFSKRNKWKC